MNVVQVDPEIYWGELPKDWQLVPLKYGFKLIGSGTTPPTGQNQYYGGPIPWVTTSELRENVITTTEKTLSELALNEFSSLKIYPTNTILFAMYGATIGRVGILGVPACVNQAVCALAQPTLFEPRFVSYSLQASRDYLFSLASGGGQPNLNAEKITEHRIPYPSLSEQHAIAAYLDHKTAKLDILIAAKERLLDLLAEKRRALITYAVTRGLNPNVPMRDSGVEWLGEIPKHWEVARLKTVCESLQTGPFGSQLHAEDYIDGGIPSINPAHLVNGRIIPDERITVDEETASRLAIHQLQAGDVVFARRGEIGRCALVTQNEAGWLCGTGSLQARPDKTKLDSEYLVSVVTNTFAGQWLSIMSVGTTMDNLNTEIIGELIVPLPPLTEQQQIILSLVSMKTSIDSLMQVITKTIELLYERRAALIAAAVSGQVRVGG
ncbi:MAG: restriction endonuclease subunit S [Anaerolineae bacterium]|nr:restriction endonuclease subunit S [Anaerolineae bacterium]